MTAPDSGLDPMAELDSLLELGRRAPGSDAERRTARHLERRLEALGRTAAIEPFAAYPAWPLAYALLAAASVGASVLAVYVPIAGAVLALAAAVVTFLDAGLLIPIARRLLGRRASQNVVSLDPSGKPGAIVLTAHYDAGRGGLAHRTTLPVGGLQLLFVAQLAVLACTLARLAGLDGTTMTIVQFVPTLALIVAVALLVDVALAGTRAGENDNASGIVLLLRLAERLGSAPEHFDLHLLFTGSQTAQAGGMRAFLAQHDLARDSTVFVNVDQVGSGDVRYTRREGALAGAKTHPQLRALVEEDAEPLVSRSASDASAAAGAGFAAITITCDDHASGRVDEAALARAESFVVELVERLDAEVGPSIVAPVEATALSEPD
jgi:hypothetical protein